MKFYLHGKIKLKMSFQNHPIFIKIANQSVNICHISRIYYTSVETHEFPGKVYQIYVELINGSEILVECHDKIEDTNNYIEKLHKNISQGLREHLII